MYPHPAMRIPGFIHVPHLDFLGDALSVWRLQQARIVSCMQVNRQLFGSALFREWSLPGLATFIDSCVNVSTEAKSSGDVLNRTFRGLPLPPLFDGLYR